MKKEIQVKWLRDRNLTVLYVSYLLKGEKAVIDFSVRAPTTHWNYWLPEDLRYHANEPQYEGQPLYHTCIYNPNGCYCDGSALAGERLFEKFECSDTFDENIIWQKLEEFYKERFGDR